MTFEQAIEHILSKEGGYVNDPKDSGGETKWGISKRSYPNLDIKALTREQAKEIYRRDFWDDLHVDALPSAIRLTFFDFAVNAGPVSATIALQKAAGVKMDGVLGPKTLTAAAGVTPVEYGKRRIEHYLRVVKLRTKDMKFLGGWMNRTLEITVASKP